MLVNSYIGYLRGPIPHKRIIAPQNYSSLSQDDTYIIESPYFKAVSEERRHNQIADKAFQSKARFALIEHIRDKGLDYQEMDRVIGSGSDTVAEWEGIFEVGGDVWFLECKNTITSISLSLDLL